jgi:hypothetical protein
MSGVHVLMRTLRASLWPLLLKKASAACRTSLCVTMLCDVLYFMYE